jgi:hypothetical protein
MCVWACVFVSESLPPSPLCIFIITFLIRSSGYVQWMTCKKPLIYMECNFQLSMAGCGLLPKLFTYLESGAGIITF